MAATNSSESDENLCTRKQGVIIGIEEPHQQQLPSSLPSATSIESLNSASKPECRICRGSAEELRRARDRLHRVKCACSGSLEHLCGGCYVRYYLEQQLDRCEICRQPIDIDEEFSENGAASILRKLQHCWSGRGPPCRSTGPCLESRFLGYACFVLVVFVVVFIIFFFVGEKLHQIRRQRELPVGVTPAAAAATPSYAVSAEPLSSSERRIEAIVFVAVACVNIAIALAYMTYAYRRRLCGGCLATESAPQASRQRQLAQLQRRRRPGSRSSSLEDVEEAVQMSQPSSRW